MADGLTDLTDKEKEALRLLLAGHDAKSSAAKLDLSVHTINDRLRNARRKLHVSSSREAARILGVSEGMAEPVDPQKSAHTSFGIVETGDGPDTADLNNAEQKGASGLNWLAGGMLIMSIVIAAAIIGVVYTSGGDDTATTVPATAQPSSQSSSSSDTPVEAASLKQAKAFLAPVDAGDWNKSWNIAGDFFQEQITAAEWAERVSPVRKPLGAVEERRLVSAQQVSTLPGAPEGDYEVLQFQTKFANREGLALETMMMLKNGNSYDVTGYFIQ
ncbi:DUF4019 domain-containing protein [Erythrobacter sp. F6033]|uniref:helix-turn-helix domain-containing protein n=1 Tax=Erythrobacter sp. F6033 TaxID=2926401 RepID=UPI001FF48B23|nr:DUF4019 domain-containing protein [Erythrobacter sp. F6033]MCK0128222.1 DUF4019 domain-containing protein [Erythrobacter sp. F6033]